MIPQSHRYVDFSVRGIARGFGSVIISAMETRVLANAIGKATVHFFVHDSSTEKLLLVVKLGAGV